MLDLRVITTGVYGDITELFTYVGTLLDYGGPSRPHRSHAAHILVITNFFSLEKICCNLCPITATLVDIIYYLQYLID